MSLKPKTLLTVISADTLPELSQITLKSVLKKQTKPRTLPPLSIGSSMENILTTITHKNIKSEQSNDKIHINQLKKNFKNNFYEDVTPSTLVKLQKKITFQDKRLSNQVVYMNKFVNFWKCFCDYSGPIVSIAKMQNAKKAIREKSKKNEEPHNIYAYHENNKQHYKQRLYTNSSIFEKHHRIRVEREKKFYKRAQLEKKNLQ